MKNFLLSIAFIFTISLSFAHGNPEKKETRTENTKEKVSALSEIESKLATPIVVCETWIIIFDLGDFEEVVLVDIICTTINL